MEKKVNNNFNIDDILNNNKDVLMRLKNNIHDTKIDVALLGLKFVIDVDDTLRDTSTRMLEIYNKEFNASLTVSDLKWYDVDASYPLVREKYGISGDEWFFDRMGDDLFLDAGILPGAKEAVDILSRYGKIIICTYQRSIDNKLQCVRWLDNHGIQYNGLVFTKDKYLVKGDVMIDDHLDNFWASECGKGVLINMPFNEERDEEEYRMEHTRLRSLTRYNSIYEFAKEFEESIHHGK